jgi:hypothetical protein
VQVKLTPKLVEVYYQDRLIKTHPVARTLRQTDWNDFPPNIQHALDEGLPRVLCMKARHIGLHFEELITQMLSVHAFLNMRRAQGLLSLARHYSPEIVDRAAERALTLRTRIGTNVFKHIIATLQTEAPLPDDELPLSGETLSYVRPPDYFTHS